MRVSVSWLVILIGLVLLFVVGGGIVAAIGRLKVPRVGHVTLTCPHCQQETPANEPKCRKCGKEL